MSEKSARFARQRRAFAATFLRASHTIQLMNAPCTRLVAIKRGLVAELKRMKEVYFEPESSD